MAALVTPFGMLSFPALFKPRAPVEGADPRYSLNLVLDEKAQKTPEFKALKDAIHQCVKDKWGDKVPSNLRNPIRDAGEKDYAGYEDGMVFISAWNKKRPGIVGPQREEIFDEKDVWAGQTARGSVKLFAYDTSGNRGVALSLENVQIGKFDMPRMDGRVAADKAFDDVDASISGGYTPEVNDEDNDPFSA